MVLNCLGNVTKLYGGGGLNFGFLLAPRRGHSRFGVFCELNKAAMKVLYIRTICERGLRYSNEE